MNVPTYEKRSVHRQPIYKIMTNLEKQYLDKFQKLIDDIIPDFNDADEELRFYEVMKRDGLNMADVSIKSCDALIEEIKTKFGSDSEIYKGISDDFVKIITDFIYVEINPNTSYINVSDLSSFQKNKFANQNQFATSLINRLEKYYKGEKNKTDIQIIKNKISAIEAKLNPKSSCYIATIIYNDCTSREVWILREFRDTYLKSKLLGRLLIRFYYNTRFTFFPLIKNNLKLQNIIKKKLDFLILKITSTR